MLATDEGGSMESLFYWGTAIVAAMGLIIFMAGLVIDRLPTGTPSSRLGKKGRPE